MVYIRIMEACNELEFRIQYSTIEQAIEAAFALGDLLEASEHVESWHAEYELCPNCGKHVALTGTVTTFFSGEALVYVGEAFAGRSQQCEGFLAGAIRAVEENA